ncbi:MAG TPA: cupredoxin domain-containing protein [Actinomycetota bacterium]|nr:cupredoxin domain-containing protein [Actinomycetota bacterium]
MTQHTSRSDMMGEIRFRVPLVVVIPLAALALIAVVAVGMSMVLLSIPKEAATVVALATALNVLGACAVLASRRRLSQTAAAELLIVVLYPVVIGIAIAALDIGEGEAHAETTAAAGSGEAAGDAGQNAISAANLQFNTNELSLPAGQETSFTLQNEDTQPHNLSIYEDDSADEALFEGDVVEGGQTGQYDIPSIPAGEYFFRCDLHPDSMVGTVAFE